MSGSEVGVTEPISSSIFPVFSLQYFPNIYFWITKNFG